MNATSWRVLDYLRLYIAERGYAPSIREIVEGAALSGPSVAVYHLKALSRVGLIKRQLRQARSIIILESPYAAARRKPAAS